MVSVPSRLEADREASAYAVAKSIQLLVGWSKFHSRITRMVPWIKERTEKRGYVPSQNSTISFLEPWTETGSYGSKYYETPNTDALAKQGMKLFSHHHCQNCVPTRAALLSTNIVRERAPIPSVVLIGLIGVPPIASIG